MIANASMANASIARVRTLLAQDGAALWLLALPLIVSAIALMLTDIGRKPFWADESIAVLPAQSILTEGVPRSPFDLNFMSWQLEDGLWDPSAPLYRYGVAAVAAIAGFSEASTRRFSVALGVLLLLPCYLLFRRTYGAKVALLAVTFLVASPWFMGFAREARHFTFVLCAMGFALLALVRAVDDESERSRALWPVFSLAAILGHAVGYQLLPILVAYLALNPRARVLSRRYLPLYAGLVLVYGAIQARYWNTLPFFHSIGCHNRVNGCQPDPFYYLGTLHEMLTGGSPLPNTLLEAPFGVSVALFLVGLAVVAYQSFRDGRFRRHHSLILVWLLLPLLLLSTRELKYPRYLFYIMPVCALLVARGVVWIADSISDPRLRAAVGVALTLLVVTAPRLQLEASRYGASPLQSNLLKFAKTVRYPQRNDDWNRIREKEGFLRRHIHPGDVVVTTFDDASLGYYVGRFVHGFLNSEHDDAYFLALLEEVGERGATLWFVNELPTHDYCHTPGPQPENIACAVKYERFYRACTPSIPEYDARCVPVLPQLARSASPSEETRGLEGIWRVDLGRHRGVIQLKDGAAYAVCHGQDLRTGIYTLHEGVLEMTVRVGGSRELEIGGPVQQREDGSFEVLLRVGQGVPVTFERYEGDCSDP